MTNTLMDRLRHAAMKHGGSIIPTHWLHMPELQNICIHRGETLRTAKLGCCGTVEIFQCAKLGHEVHNTKCKTCEFFFAPK